MSPMRRLTLACLLVIGALGSLSAETAQIQTASPDLTDTSLDLPGIAQDVADGSNAGTSVASLLAASFADPDLDDAGVAIIAVSSTGGTWQYTTNYIGAGSSWSSIIVVAGSALRLSGSTGTMGGIRFRPNAGFSGTVSSGVQLRAWDASDGYNHGGNGPIGATGSATAYSDEIAAVAIVVSAAGNNAPTLTTGTSSLPGTTFAARDSDNGELLSTLVGGAISDVDAGALEGIAVTVVDGTQGTWQYKQGAGAWTDFGAVSSSAALLLPDTARVRFYPSSAFTGTRDLGFVAWDQTSGTAYGTGDTGSRGSATAFSTGSAIIEASVTAPAVNSAPVLAAGAFTLATTSLSTRDSDNGALVSSLVGGSITDVDSGDLEGIAVFAADSSQGIWQYKTTGGWTTLTPVSVGAARLLPDSARIRFYPSSDFAGTPDLQFRAWDRTAGTAEGVHDTTTTGGATPFSAVDEVIEATVVLSVTLPVAVNEPALTRSGSRTSFYNAVCPSTSAGETSLLSELARIGSRNARGFIWDATAQAYAELPAASAAMTEQSGVFLATRSAMNLDFDGLAQDRATFEIVLKPGWNFFGVPPLDEGGTALTSHPWANFELRSIGGTLIDGSSTPTFSDVINATPAWWDPGAGAYVNQTTLETGRGYWIRNNQGTDFKLRRLMVPAARVAGPQAAAVASQSTPPAPPASSAGSDDGDGGCGKGGLGGIVAAGLLLMLRLRRSRG